MYKLIVYVRNDKSFVPNGFNSKSGRGFTKTTYSFNKINSEMDAKNIINNMIDDGFTIAKAYYNHKLIRIPEKSFQNS